MNAIQYNPAGDAYAKMAMYNIFQQTQHENPALYSGQFGQELTNVFSNFKTDFMNYFRENAVGQEKLAYDRLLASEILQRAAQNHPHLADHGVASVIDGLKDNALNYFSQAQKPEHWHIYTQHNYESLLNNNAVNEGLAATFANQLTISPTQQEYNVATEKLYEAVSQEIKKEVIVSSGKSLTDKIIEKAIDRALGKIVDESVDAVRRVIINNKESILGLASVAAHDLLKSNSDPKKEEQIKQDFLSKTRDEKRMILAKEMQECIFNPTPGCNEEIKKKMDELNKEGI